MSCNKLSAEIWNQCVILDSEYQELHQGKQMKFGDLQSAIKGYNNLHSRGITIVFRKYFDARSNMWKSIKAKHENSNKVKIPYKEKKFFNTGWDYQSLQYDYTKNIIMLPKSKLGKGGYGKRQNI